VRTPAESLALSIEPFVDVDIPAVQAIDAQVYARTWSAKLLADDIARDNRHHLVARADGRIVGHASLMILGDEGHVSTVAVDPEFQRRGVARSLVLALCQFGVSRELDLLTLEVRASNRAAQRLYSAFGFAPVGVRPRYYEPDREDALILTAHNITSQDFADRLVRQANLVEGRANNSQDSDTGDGHD